MIHLAAYTTNGRIVIPEVQIKEDHLEYTYVPLKGYAYVMAVFGLDKECIGWIMSTTLGQSDVMTWMKNTNWTDQGY